MTHPSFDHGAIGRAHPQAHAILQKALAIRLSSLAKTKLIAIASAEMSARLFISLAHDWALANILVHGTPARERELKEMVDIVWSGMRPHDSQ
jgi:hypothetical protein